MKRINLTMNETKKYQVIKAVAENKKQKKRASIELNLSIRQINRLVKSYRENGKSAFVHKNRGIPATFLTDKRPVFEYNRKSTKAVEEDTFTQFGFACHQLGIDIKTSSIPQAKDRVERLNGTVQ